MTRGRGFLEAVLETYPAMKARKNSIKAENGLWRMKRQADEAYPGDVTIGIVTDADVAMMGRHVGIALQILDDHPEESVTIADQFRKELEKAFRDDGLPLLKISIDRFRLNDGKVYPCTTATVSEIQGDLTEEIREFTVHHDKFHMESPYPGHTTIEGMMDWRMTQCRLRAQAEEHGLMIDPVFCAMLDKAKAVEIIDFIRNPKTKTEGSLMAKKACWNDRDLERAGMETNGEVIEITCRNGGIMTSISLAPSMVWNAIRMEKGNTKLNAEVRFMGQIPETMKQSCIGGRLSKVIEHPWLPDDVIIKNIEDQDAGDEVRTIVRVETHTVAERSIGE